MQDPMSIQSVERKVFRTAFTDGLWDVLIGCFVLEFAIAPLFSKSLGDFWSSAIFLPFWGLVYLAIWLARKYVVAPRIGVVSFGKTRKRKLRRFTLVMLVINVLALILGIIVFFTFTKEAAARFNESTYYVPALMGISALLIFSAAALMLDYPRLFAYALLLFVSPLVGEWLYQNHRATHHGYPIVFGFSAVVIILTGLSLFIHLLITTPPLNAEES